MRSTCLSFRADEANLFLENGVPDCRWTPVLDIIWESLNATRTATKIKSRGHLRSVLCIADVRVKQISSESSPYAEITYLTHIGCQILRPILHTFLKISRSLYICKVPLFPKQIYTADQGHTKAQTTRAAIRSCLHFALAYVDGTYQEATAVRQIWDVHQLSAQYYRCGHPASFNARRI